MSTIKFLFVTISFMLATGICQSEETLEAKIAKLNAKIKAERSIAKSSKTEAVDKQAYKKSLEERIAELQAQQNKFSKDAAGRDRKLSSFESKFAALRAKIRSQHQDYSNAVSGSNEHFAKYEHKLETVQNYGSLSKRIALLEQKIEAMGDHTATIQVKNDSQVEDNDITSELELKAGSLETSSRLDMYEMAPVSANFLSTTNVASQDSEDSIWTRESPTNGFWGLNDMLEPYGIEVGLGVTSLYQANVKGGTSTRNRRGRHSGRYDLEASVDLEKLFGINGWSFFMHGWGGWPNDEGIDGVSVGSTFGTSALAVGNRSMDIVECFFEGPLFSDNLTMRIGKVDFTGIFDASEYADDEAGQFLNASLVDNSTIPFPAQGLGVVLTWDITDWWYLMGGAVDAQGDNRETGFRTALHEEDYYFYALETGVTPEFESANGALGGTYRVGMWVDGQDKERFSDARNHRDDVGVYTSCDQMLYKENDDSEDTQGLGAFLRYGWASSKYNSVTNFVSGGFQYQGLFEGRDDDVIGIGYSHGSFSDDDAANFPSSYESVFEAYYNAQITPWFALGPSIQYVANPSDGEGTTAKDAVVVGLRAQVTF